MHYRSLRIQMVCQILLPFFVVLVKLANCTNGITNPIGHHADPQPVSRIAKDGKRWYYFPTANTGEGTVDIYASPELNDIYSSQNKHTIFSFTKNVHQNPEAPALFKWNESNYVIYISSDAPTGNRLYALHNDGKDLTSGWTFAGVVQYADGRSLIGYDAAALNHPNGNKYLFYTNTTTIFVNKLLPEYGFATVEPSVDGKGTIAASRIDRKYTEAPEVLIKGDRLNFLYSQNSFFSSNYTTYNNAVPINADPLNSETWSKSKSVQVLASNEQNGVYGTGSVGAFIGPGEKPWIAYTCFYSSKSFNRYTSDPRYTQIQPIMFKNNEIQPLIPTRPGHKVEKVQKLFNIESYIPRYTNLDLRFFKTSLVHYRKR